MNKDENKKDEVKKDEADVIIEKVDKVVNTVDLSSTFPKEEVEKNKVYALMSYIFCLFLYPLLKNVNKNSPYVNFHVNQGINLCILEVGVYIFNNILGSLFLTGDIVKTVPPFINLIIYILYCALFALVLIGVINTANGKSKELPLIGKYRFIKIQPIKEEPKEDNNAKTQTASVKTPEIVEIKDDNKTS